jgi:hypothetical protein
MDKEITRQLFENQIAIMTAALASGLPTGVNEKLHKAREETQALMLTSTLCLHDWESGFSMNGPTRTCKRCGKWERD